MSTHPDEFRGSENPSVEQLTIQALQAALARCMSAHPAEGRELRLHPDADRMANVLGLMIYRHVTSMPLADVDPVALDAYRRWHVEGGR